VTSLQNLLQKQIVAFKFARFIKGKTLQRGSHPTIPPQLIYTATYAGIFAFLPEDETRSYASSGCPASSGDRPTLCARRGSRSPDVELARASQVRVDPRLPTLAGLAIAFTTSSSSRSVIAVSACRTMAAGRAGSACAVTQLAVRKKSFSSSGASSDHRSAVCRSILRQRFSSLHAFSNYIIPAASSMCNYFLNS